MTAHIPAGHVNGVWAPAGTILGPKVVTRELVVVTGYDHVGVTVGYATTGDVDAAADRDPQSVTEARAAQAANPYATWVARMFGSPR